MTIIMWSVLCNDPDPDLTFVMPIVKNCRIFYLICIVVYF